MSPNDERQSGGGIRWRRSSVVWMVGCGLAIAAVGCGQPVPSTMSAAGDFFRRVGPLTMMRADEGASSDEVAPGQGVVETQGSVPEIPDSKIRLDLGMKLQEAEVSTSEVDVRVDDQRVVLEGTAASLTARDRIELLAREIEGVAAVENRLGVADKTSSPVGRADGGRKKQK